jgi:hypothetical protein
MMGLAPILGARPVAQLLGFPSAHDTPTTRLFARLFGVRDIGLGILVFWALQDVAMLRFVFLFNAAHDLADALVIGVPLVHKQGIDRAAYLSLACALGGLMCWLITWWLLA